MRNSACTQKGSFLSSSINTLQIKLLPFINSKVVYVKKHLACEVHHLEKIKFLLSLNVLYRGQTIKLAVGTMAEPLHT